MYQSPHGKLGLYVPAIKTATDLLTLPMQIFMDRRKCRRNEKCLRGWRSNRRPAQVPQSQTFLEEWLARCQELVDKYKPDMFWFDNGINSRSLDSIKLRFAAYYYNSAKMEKDVSISTKVMLTWQAASVILKTGPCTQRDDRICMADGWPHWRKIWVRWKEWN